MDSGKSDRQHLKKRWKYSSLTSGLNNTRRGATPDRSSSSGSIGLSDNRPPPEDNRPPPDSPRNSTPRGSPTRGSLRDSPPPHTRGQPPTEEANIEDPQIQLENAWTSTLSDLAVDAKNGTLSSNTLTNELVSLNLQFMAQEKGPKPAQQRRLEVNGVSNTYIFEYSYPKTWCWQPFFVLGGWCF